MMRVLIQKAVVILGALLMGIGAFVPMLSIPILRDDSYFNLSPAGAVIILALGGISLLIAILSRFRLLYLTGLLAIGLLVHTYFTVQDRKMSAQSDLTEHVINTPLRDLSHGLIKSVGLSYGWPMMMLGAAMIVAVPLLGARLTRKEKVNR